MEKDHTSDETYLLRSNILRGVRRVSGESELVSLISSGNELNVKYFVNPEHDPDFRDLALLMKLRDFQKIGSHIVLVVDDMQFLKQDTNTGVKNYRNIAAEAVSIKYKGLVDLKGVEIASLSSFVEDLGFQDIANLLEIFKIQDLIYGLGLNTYLENKRSLPTSSLMLPAISTIASAKVNANIEISYEENEHFLKCSQLVQNKIFKQTPQLNMIIDKLDFNRKSSTNKKSVLLSEPAENIYGWVMSIPDEYIIDCFTFCTRLDLDIVDSISRAITHFGINPIMAKKELALLITSEICGSEMSIHASNTFERKIQKKEILQDDITEYSARSSNISNLLVEMGFAKSKNEARKLINNNGIKLNGQIVNSYNLDINDGDILQKGKRSFVRIHI